MIGACALAALVGTAAAQIPDHPIITEVYTDPSGLNDGPVGRDLANLHQEFVEIYLPPVASLSGLLNKDALRLAFYEVEGDQTSSGVDLVNYRFDLPTFDLDPSNGLTPGAVARPSSGVVVLGWVDYIGNPPTALAGTASTRVGLVDGGITVAPANYVFVPINGNHFGGTTNFPTLVAENLIDLPSEAGSGVIQNGSGAYLLVDRDAVGYVELCDDKHAADCVAGVDPNLPDDGAGLRTSALLDGYAANDDSLFDVTMQPYAGGSGVDLDTALPFGGAFSLLVPQVPEEMLSGPNPGIANGYARVYVDQAKTTENASSLDDDPVADALNEYRHVRNEGPFFPTPGQAVLTTSPPELSVALGTIKTVEVLAETTYAYGLLAANVGGDYGIDVTATPGASSDPSVATFSVGPPVSNVPGQSYATPQVNVTGQPTAPHLATASASVTVTATNSNVGDPGVVAPVQVSSVTATVLRPTTGLDAFGAPLQATVFMAIQPVPADAGSLNEFLATDLAAYVAANLGAGVQETRGISTLLLDPSTNLNDGFLMQSLIKDFPDPGFYINPPAPGVGKLDLVQTVQQSAEVISGSSTYDNSIDLVGGGLRAIRLNHTDTVTFGGTFTPSESLYFVDSTGAVADPNSALSGVTTTRSFELVIVDTNIRDDSSIETGATDDFGLILEVQDTEPGSPVIDGEYVFLSYTGGLQGADIDSVDVPPSNNVATLIYLDLDNLHDVLGIRTVEQIFVVDGGGSGTLDVVEVYSLNPVGGFFLSSVPVTDSSLWRSAGNTVRVNYGANIAAPLPGQVVVQELLPGGALGPDLSAGFTFTVENNINGVPRVLKVVDTGASDLVHRKWYTIRSAGGVWTGGGDFAVDYVVQIGDANNDGAVLNLDAGLINAGVPNFAATDQDRRDIDGDATILNDDVSTANVYIPSFRVAKPSGH